MKYLIVGLGNIGPQYEKTRHNIGFMVLDELAKGAAFKSSRYADYLEVKNKGRTLHLIKPTTFMNLSGKAVRYWMQELKIPVENLLVLTDDINLPLGKIRIKTKGSSGGHNGLKNIEELLQSSEYPRLRFGVGSEFSNGNQVDYVLGEFGADEQELLKTNIERAVNACKAFSTIGIARTMNEFNG